MKRWPAVQRAVFTVHVTCSVNVPGPAYSLRMAPFVGRLATHKEPAFLRPLARLQQRLVILLKAERRAAAVGPRGGGLPCRPSLVEGRSGGARGFREHQSAEELLSVISRQSARSSWCRSQ